ncbi:MAG: hypothetical protein HYW71_03145 [Candidatus Niyogibacteria bacterium]|nr:hypothetical protein [Candidatus Niyogibacteria bacterium]
MKLFGIRRRVIGGLIAIFLLSIFAFYDSNFLESLGQRKTFSKINRIVTVKLVPDRSFIRKRKQEEWLGEISRTLKAASEIFEREFGIRIISGDFEVWEDSAKIADIKKLLRDVKYDSCDIIIGFTKRKLDFDDKVPCGIARGNAIILKSEDDFKKQRMILTHEIAHLFFALDYNGKGLMNFNIEESAEEEIDIFNWRIIIRNKYQDFHKYDWLFFL